MQVVTSYGIHIRDHYDALKRTAEIFSDAVTYLTGVAFRNWENLSLTDSSYTRLRMMECLIEYSGHPRASVPDLQGHLSGVSRPGKNYQSIPAPKACVPEL